MTFFTFSALFIFGLIFGSFLNVVIFRYNPDNFLFSPAPLQGRSKCRNCGKTLVWYELIPLFSFLFQLGRCRNCGEKLSWQYPLVEFLSGLIFLCPIYFYSPLAPVYSVVTGFFWVLALMLFLLLAVIDYYWFIIPDELNILIAILGLVKVSWDNLFGDFGYFTGSFVGSFAALFGLRENIWLNHAAGAAAGLLIVGLIIWITKEKGMGWGDFKLIGALGILFGWPDVIFLLAFSFIIGSVYSLAVLAAGKKGMKDSVPFGPFLVFGSLALIFFGNDILRAYFTVFI